MKMFDTGERGQGLVRILNSTMAKPQAEIAVLRKRCSTVASD